MITVTFKINGREQFESVEVKGHADHGPHGHDIVCAGVSAVTYGLANALMLKSDKRPPVVEAKEGHLYILLVNDALTNHLGDPVMQNLMHALLISLQTIEKEYPENVVIRTEREERPATASNWPDW